MTMSIVAAAILSGRPEYSNGRDGDSYNIFGL